MKQTIRCYCRRKLKLFILLSAVLAFILLPGSYKALAQSKNYVVTADMAPMNSNYTLYSTYNEDTRPYYMLRSYLEQLETDGGGTLTLSAGTYEISNTLYVPSNVTIDLMDGVIIRKLDTGGAGGLQSSKCIFTFAAPSKSDTQGAYRGYSGETNIRLIGNGTAVIDLNYDTDCLGITIGHNTNIEISGITFQNMRSGHFIEMDASQNVTIENNNFLHHEASSTGIKEAINIDTPDIQTNGFHAVWSSYDCTPDQDVVIRNNHFDDLERAIGTHKYSQGKYHTNIHILNNEISNTSNDAIRVLNWKNPIIMGNTIKMVAGDTGNKRAILVSGVINPTITNNTFINVPRPIQIFPWKNTGSGSKYEVTYNNVNWGNITLMLENTLVNVKEKYIRINEKYKEYSKNTDKYFFKNKYIYNLKDNN